MNKSKCKGCQWNNKPYWSIINPCENCYRDEVQTITNWVDPTIKQLQQENKQLKEKINKAIEMFETGEYFEDGCYCEKIAKLLKGDSNE